MCPGHQEGFTCLAQVLEANEAQLSLWGSDGFLISPARVWWCSLFCPRIQPCSVHKGWAQGSLSKQQLRCWIFPTEPCPKALCPPVTALPLELLI